MSKDWILRPFLCQMEKAGGAETDDVFRSE